MELLKKWRMVKSVLKWSLSSGLIFSMVTFLNRFVPVEASQADSPRNVSLKCENLMPGEGVHFSANAKAQILITPSFDQSGNCLEVFCQDLEYSRTLQCQLNTKGYHQTAVGKSSVIDSLSLWVRGKAKSPWRQCVI